jgi:UrcA family protein
MSQIMNRATAFCAAGARTSRVAFVAAVGAAAVLLLSVAPARAAPLDDHVAEHTTVRFADLDLSSQKDTKRLYMRLRNAAEQVCGDYDPLDLFDIQGARKCQDDAIAHAVAQLNQPRLTALYDRAHPRA